MKMAKDMIGTAIGVAMIVSFTSLIFALVLSLASEQMPALKTIGTEIRCLVGVPDENSTCVRKRIAALDSQRRALEAERQQLVDVIAAQDFVFTQGDWLRGGVSLVVGTLYEDAEARSRPIRSFCWAVVDRPGLDPRVGLAVMERDGRVQATPVGSAERLLLGVSAHEVEAARAACPFPGRS